MGSLANGGTPDVKGLHRAEEVEDLIDAVKTLIIPFIKSADEPRQPSTPETSLLTTKDKPTTSWWRPSVQMNL